VIGSTITAKAAALALSAAAHAALAVVALAGGHAAGDVGVPTPGSVELAPSVEIESSESSIEEPKFERQPEPARETAARARTRAQEARPTHSHPYPVAADHDAYAHDPGLPHRHAAAPADPYAPSVPGAPPPAAGAQHAASPVAGSRAPAASASLRTFDQRGARGAGVSGPALGSREGAGGSDPAFQARASGPLPASRVTVQARALQRVAPAFPPDARAQEVSGHVDLEIVVDQSGSVASARVVRRAGYGFDEAALAAIGRFRFSPATLEGRPVAVRMPWRVEFRLE
jgi:TonB family protein